ncbi:hypothetical protein HMI56_003096 [Coelomomyces lativittatus]|nr:hypothetical protein HMI56_003096 [Coelomomyces lativittatus]
MEYLPHPDYLHHPAPLIFFLSATTTTTTSSPDPQALLPLSTQTHLRQAIQTYLTVPFYAHPTSSLSWIFPDLSLSSSVTLHQRFLSTWVDENEVLVTTCSTVTSAPLHPKMGDSSHGPYSPWTPSSPLYPDGLLCKEWFHQYAHTRPCVVVHVLPIHAPDLPQSIQQGQAWVSKGAGSNTTHTTTNTMPTYCVALVLENGSDIGV